MSLAAEQVLSARDPILAGVIVRQPARWPCQPTEDPIWGLVRIVMAQQISTQVACRLAERAKSAYPMLTTPCPDTVPEAASLRAFGLSKRRAQCCVTILQRSDEIRAKVRQGQTWEEALAGIKGIGPWTLSVFRIMVLRDPDNSHRHEIKIKKMAPSGSGPASRWWALHVGRTGTRLPRSGSIVSGAFDLCIL